MGNWNDGRAHQHSRGAIQVRSWSLRQLLDAAPLWTTKGNRWARVHPVAEERTVRNRSPSRLPAPLVDFAGWQFVPVVNPRENGRLWDGFIQRRNRGNLRRPRP